QAKSALPTPPDSHFSRVLGDQVRIAGSRRIGPRVLLEFIEEAGDIPSIFAPVVSIKAAIQVSGPIYSALTQRLAPGTRELVAAICALALGRAVKFPWAVFPAETEMDYSIRFRSDETIPNLARDHVSLDIFNDFQALGGVDGSMRARGSLLSYHAALRQSSPDVAMMLFVSAMEARI